MWPGWLIEEHGIGIACRPDGLYKAIDKVRKDRDFVKKVMESGSREIKEYDKGRVFRDYESMILSVFREGQKFK